MIKEHYAELYDLIFRKRELVFKLADKQEELMSVKGIRYDKEMSSSHITVDMSCFIQEIEDIKKEISELEIQIKQLENKFKKEINKVTSNIFERRVLALYYIHRYKLKDISKAMNYSDRHIRRIKNNADIKYSNYLKDVL